MPKSWSEKLRSAKPAHTVVLEKPYAGLPPGAILFIASPLLLQERVAAILEGRTLGLKELREALARENGAHATCPTSTSIFLRIVAEAALEQAAAGTPLHAVTPFWRVVEPESPLARKLSCGPDLVREMRAREGGMKAAA